MERKKNAWSSVAAMLLISGVASAGTFGGNLNGTGQGDVEWNPGGTFSGVDVCISSGPSSSMNLRVWASKYDPASGTYSWVPLGLIEPGHGPVYFNNLSNINKIAVGGPNYSPPSDDPSAMGSASYRGSVT